jgi:protein-tyrosine kinase
MENIRQAVERAKAQTEQQGASGPQIARRQTMRGLGATVGSEKRAEEVELDFSYLQSQSIVAYDGADPRSRPFDVLRTEILRSMDLKDWKILAVTSPTPSCGKTLTAVNLALSMARQPERQVFLADLDLRKPRVGAVLGLKCGEGLLGVVEERVEVAGASMQVRAGNSRLDVLPTAPASNASDLVDSKALARTLREIAEYGRSRIVILDLPPLLAGHDVISILPQVDCVLLVGAVGVSKVADIEECSKYLRDTDVVRFVLNKVPESATQYAYY